MDINTGILSELTVFSKYSKFIPDLERRETWEEIVDRNKAMHLKKFPDLSSDIERAYSFVYSKKIFPSMRSMQFAGKPIEFNNSRIFNCAYLPMENWKAFREVMFLLLSGTGVGYSVQEMHIKHLPALHMPDPERRTRFVIGDSIEGWSDAINALMKNYFFGGRRVKFIYDDIRKKGEPLITAGGKAPGPDPLRACIEAIEELLMSKNDGDFLTDLDVHRINCLIANAVLAGGIRRAAMIALFDQNSKLMLTCKSGNWWEKYPELARANNSAVLLRSETTKEDFDTLWMKIEESGSGEPGFYFTNDKDWGTNPCCEIALKPYQFCNLTEINASDISSQADFNSRAWAASLIGTLQATYTDFHYLRPIWRATTEEDALVGVGMTGIASNKVFEFDIPQASRVVLLTNELYAKALGINKAARTTTVKPAGTTSLVGGSSSGIHAWHDKFFVRRMRLGKNEALYRYLEAVHPNLIEDCKFSPNEIGIVSIPVKAPEGATTREESAMDLLERVKKISYSWVKAGHREGVNTHNVSATISLKKEDWKEVGEWMWENRYSYNGLSVLPYDGGTYVQAPFETITEEQYIEMSKGLTDINLINVREDMDYTDLKGEAACAGGACEII